MLHCIVALHTTRTLCQSTGGMTDEVRTFVEAVLDRVKAFARELMAEDVKDTLSIANDLGVVPRREVLDAVLGRALDFAKQLPSVGPGSFWALQVLADCTVLKVDPESDLVKTLRTKAYHAMGAGSYTPGGFERKVGGNTDNPLPCWPSTCGPLGVCGLSHAHKTGSVGSPAPLQTVKTFTTENGFGRKVGGNNGNPLPCMLPHCGSLDACGFSHAHKSKTVNGFERLAGGNNDNPLPCMVPHCGPLDLCGFSHASKRGRPEATAEPQQ
ncbi:hypothetical protein T484DRAFT_1911161, partial [Baffinella frigidus]